MASLHPFHRADNYTRNQPLDIRRFASFVPVVALMSCSSPAPTQPQPAAPAPSASRAPVRSQVSARPRGRRGNRAAVCRRLFLAAAQAEDADLASVPGGARRPRHLHRSEAPRRARDARGDRADRRLSAGRRCRGAFRDSAIREVVLVEQRPVQQPDGAKVRVEPHAGEAQGRGRGLREERRALHDRQRNDRSEARAVAADVLRSDRGSDRHQQDTRRRQGHPASERQQPLLRRLDGGPEGLQREVRPQLAAR